MTGLLIETSNYILAFLIAIYAIFSVLIFTMNDSTGRSVISGLQNTINILIAAVGLMHLYMYYKKPMYLAICMFMVLSIFLLPFLTTIIYKEANRIILNNMSMLFTTGLLILSRISINKATKQYIIFMFCFAICMIFPYIFTKITFLKKIKWVYGGVGLTMIAIVMLFSEVTKGSKLSFTAFGITFQPSEFVKILFVFYIAASLWADNSFKNILITSLVCASHIMVLVVSKDLGAALIFFITYIFMLVIATANYWYLILGSIMMSLASVLAFKIFSHVRNRVIVWQDPWTYVDTKGYQITQGLFSITNGGLFGMGLGQGNPTNIPYVETDFIFCAICEEMGLIYAISLLVIFISSFIEMLRISAKINDKFYSLIVYGIAISMTFQVFLTVGGGTKFIPLTGVTLPLISYGGTSFMATMIMYFIVQSIYIRLRKIEKREDDKLVRFHPREAVNEKK